MLKKQELLKMLKEAYDTEEMSIPIYMRHLKSAVFWTGIDKEKTDKIRKILGELASGSEGHKKVVVDLINEIKESKKDAF